MLSTNASYRSGRSKYAGGVVECVISVADRPVLSYVIDAEHAVHNNGLICILTPVIYENHSIECLGVSVTTKHSNIVIHV